MSPELYEKEYCIKLAKEILEKGQITGMSVNALAHEIYAHAYVCYHLEILPGFLKNNYLYKRGYKGVTDGVDLTDNGDKWYRRIGYMLIWFFPRIRKLKK